MKSYALIKNNIVENIIVFDNPSEELVQQFKEIHNADLLIETTDSCAVGGEYDGTNFWTIKPFPSWVKNEETGMWETPVPYPNDDKIYAWNETDKNWVLLSQ
jgi:hypothetical protein